MPPKDEKKSDNFAIFLGGTSGADKSSDVSMGRSKSEGRGALGEHGQTINSNTSENHGIFLRGGSVPPKRTGYKEPEASDEGRSGYTTEVSPAKDVKVTNLADLKGGLQNVNLVDNKVYIDQKKK